MLERDLAAVPTLDGGGDGRPVALDDLIDVAHGQPGAHGGPGGDPRDVGALDELLEQLDELLALGRRPDVPVAPEDEPCGQARLEAIGDDRADRGV